MPKPKPFLLIDGYNLMHAAGMARRNYGPGGLAKSRNWLLNYVVRRLTSDERKRTTIVFDAADAPPGVSRHSVLEGIEIMFASAGGDADTQIEELISEHSAPRLLRVVSSDHRLQKAARRRRANFVDSEVFVAELERRGPISQSSPDSNQRGKTSHPKFTGQTSEKETEAWLEVFGDIPEAAELQDEAQRWESQLQDPPDDLED